MPIQVPLILAILMHLLPAAMVCGNAGAFCPELTSVAQAPQPGCCGSACAEESPDSLPPCGQEGSDSRSCCFMCCSLVTLPLCVPRLDPAPILPVNQAAIEPIGLPAAAFRLEQSRFPRWCIGPPVRPPGVNVRALLCCWTT